MTHEPKAIARLEARISHLLAELGEANRRAESERVAHIGARKAKQRLRHRAQAAEAELDAARAEGVRAGLEAAAKICEPQVTPTRANKPNRINDQPAYFCWEVSRLAQKDANEIRAIAADPEAVAAIVAEMKGQDDD